MSKANPAVLQTINEAISNNASFQTAYSELKSVGFEIEADYAGFVLTLRDKDQSKIRHKSEHGNFYNLVCVAYRVLRENAESLISTEDRELRFDRIWSKAHKDYRGCLSDGTRTVMGWMKHGGGLVCATSISLEELLERSNLA